MLAMCLCTVYSNYTIFANKYMYMYYKLPETVKWENMSVT